MQRFLGSNGWEDRVNIESRKYFRPGRIGRRHGIAAALREAVEGRFDRLPGEFQMLLDQLDWSKKL